MFIVIVFVLLYLLFSLLGGFTIAQSLVLSFIFTSISYEQKNKSKKTELTIDIDWKNLIRHSEYPNDLRSKLNKIFEKMREEDDAYGKSFSFRFVIDGMGMSAWSDYHKSVITAHKTMSSETGMPKSLILLYEKPSHILLQETKNEPILAIEEFKGRITFSFIYQISSQEEDEVKEICSFPSSSLYSEYQLFRKRTLKKYGFEVIDNYFSELEFKNEYFTIKINHLQ